MTAIVTFGLTTVTIAQVPSYVPTSGLAGWWPFNGNANDESGNGNNGANNGATLTLDRYTNPNSAYSFNGASKITCLNTSGISVDTVSVSAWVKQSTSFGNSEFICLGSTGGTNWGVIASNNNIKFNQGRGCGPGEPIALNNYTMNLNTWYHFVLVSNGFGGNSLIYINGTYIGSTINNTSGGCPASNLFFGVDIFSEPEYINGILDDIGIWNRALTQQEITDLYNGCQLSVNTQPTNQTININSNAQFIVGSSDSSATYQWQTDLGFGFQNLSNAGQYSGVTTGTLTVFNVTMSNNNQNFRSIVSSGSCSDTSNVAVLTVNNNVGINETSQDKLFSVFPNPAQSVINVKADSKLIGSVYSIYDNTGRVVLSGKLNAESTTIELGNLSGGIYMFSVGENMKQSFKVIKE